MKNDYEIRGNVTAIFLNSYKYGKLETLISTNKLEKAQEFQGTWYVHWDSGTRSFYCNGTIKLHNDKRTTVQLHRWITDCVKYKQIDHLDNDTLNNVDKNLREVTAAENLQNLKGAQKNSKSGFRGVDWNSRSKKWRARICVNRKIMHLGYYDDVLEADNVVKMARAKYMPYSKEASSLQDAFLFPTKGVMMTNHGVENVI